MNLEKESKMLEQGIVIWLLFAAIVVIVWAATFVSAIYLFKFAAMSSVLSLAVSFGTATILTAGFILTAKKILWK